jgi:tRNA pseudouridine55 synthase
MKARPVEIHAIEVVDYAFPRLTLDVRCGKGTYIRSLARDIGSALGAGGMLAGLRRTAVGDFTIGRAIALDDLPEPMGQEHLLDLPS